MLGYLDGFKNKEKRFAAAVTQNGETLNNTKELSAPVSLEQYNELIELLNKHKIANSDQHSKEADIVGHAMLAGKVR